MNNNIVEKISYLTDILQSYSGVEQRIKIRQYPRKYYSYRYDAMDKFQAQWLRGILRIPQQDIYYCPMWQDVIHLTENYERGSVLYIEEISMYSLHNCNMIEVFVEDDVLGEKEHIIRAVKRYSAGIISLIERINHTLDYRNTYIFPLRPCRLQSPYELNYIYSNGTETYLHFEDILDVPNIRIPSNYLTQYEIDEDFNKFNLPLRFNNRDVIPFTPQWVEDSDVVLSITKNVETLDNSTGMVKYDYRNIFSYDLHTLDVYMMSRGMINNCKKFFHKVSGRFKSFYAPTWVNDVEVLGDIVAGRKYILTKFRLDDFYEYSRHRYLILFTRDYQSYIYDLVRYEKMVIDGDEKHPVTAIYVKEPIDQMIMHDNIFMVSYFNLVRLDSDDLELHYESDCVAQVTLTMKEVDDDEL